MTPDNKMQISMTGSLIIGKSEQKSTKSAKPERKAPPAKFQCLGAPYFTFHQQRTKKHQTCNDFITRWSFSDMVDGWLTCDFMSFSTVFQSYEDDERLIMKGCVQWNLVYG